jgi:hypothetical protein
MLPSCTSTNPKPPNHKQIVPFQAIYVLKALNSSGTSVEFPPLAAIDQLT